MPTTYHQTLELESVDAEHSDRLGGMCLDRQGGVEQMEEAVMLLVENLVKPVLPQGLELCSMAPEKQSTAAWCARWITCIARPPGGFSLQLGKGAWCADVGGGWGVGEHRTCQILSLLPFIVYIHVCCFPFLDDKVLAL